MSVTDKPNGDHPIEVALPEDGYINEPWAKHVCKIGQGEKRCRFIVMAQRGWSCEKSTSLGKFLNHMAEQMRQIGRGDNCSGLRPR